MSQINLFPSQPSVAAEGQGGGSDDLDQDAFLQLLTVQLQNQDPMNPVANEDFIAQMAQLTSVQELIGIRQSLEAVYSGIAALNNAGMANLLDSQVVALGDRVNFSGEAVDLHYDADQPVNDAVLTVRDDSGQTVRTITLGGLGSGEGSVSWDGLDDNGNPVPEGIYTFSVAGVDDSGSSVGVTTLISGTVVEMDYSSGTPLPSVDGVTVDISDILRLSVRSEE